MHILHVGGSKEVLFSNSLVPLDWDLEYTIEGASDIRTKSVSAIHTGENVIFFRLELLWCCSLISTWATVNLRLEKKHLTARQSKVLRSPSP